MKTMLLVAIAVLVIGAAAAFANAPQGAGRSTALRPQRVEDRKASTAHQPPSGRSYSTPSQMHDAWQNNGLNGGGGSLQTDHL